VDGVGVIYPSIECMEANALVLTCFIPYIDPISLLDHAASHKLLQGNYLRSMRK
jgi:hypothetical protein